jgi:hypothetical protein
MNAAAGLDLARTRPLNLPGVYALPPGLRPGTRGWELSAAAARMKSTEGRSVARTIVRSISRDSEIISEFEPFSVGDR